MSTGRMTLRADGATFERIDAYALEKCIVRGRSAVVRKALNFFFEHGDAADDLDKYAMCDLAGALYSENGSETNADYKHIDDICARALRAYRNNGRVVVERYAREFLAK